MGDLRSDQMTGAQKEALRRLELTIEHKYTAETYRRVEEALVGPLGGVRVLLRAGRSQYEVTNELMHEWARESHVLPTDPMWGVMTLMVHLVVWRVAAELDAA